MIRPIEAPRRAPLAAIARAAGFVAALAALAACKSETPRLRLGSGCSFNSECAERLQCKLGTCKQECLASRDCASGQRCVQIDGVGVCLAADELSCARGCKAPLSCAPDQQCRNRCDAQVPCRPTQVCVATPGRESFCADPNDPFAGAPPDAGVTADAPGDTPASGDTAADTAAACGRAGAACCNGTTCEGQLSCSKPSARCSCIAGCSGFLVLRNDGSLYVTNGNTVVSGADGMPWKPAGISDLTGSWSSNPANQGGCVLASGSAWCWGTNLHGRLGAGIPNPSSAVPRQVVTTTGMTLTGLTSLASHFAITTTCATDMIGRVWCWGQGDSGQLGTGTATTVNAATMVLTASGAPFTDAVVVGVSFNHACAIKQDGSLWCWGHPFPLQPTQLAMSGAKSLSCALDFCCISTSPWGTPGTVWCQGDKADPKTAFVLGADKNAPVSDAKFMAAGRGNLLQAVRLDGSVIEWDSTFAPKPAFHEGTAVTNAMGMGDGCLVTNAGVHLPSSSIPACD